MNIANTFPRVIFYGNMIDIGPKSVSGCHGYQNAISLFLENWENCNTCPYLKNYWMEMSSAKTVSYAIFPSNSLSSSVCHNFEWLRFLDDAW